MGVTIKDIARRVGKSITTVSRALHDYDDVSPETKELVRKAAEEMGYTANKQASSLQKRKSDAIGLILPSFGPRFSDPFFSEFIAGVGKMANQHGLDLVVSTQAPGEGEIQAYRQLVQSRRVDGFVLVRVRAHDERIEYLQQAGMPFIAFGRTLEKQDFAFVDIDSIDGMHQVAEHLLALGHRRIAVILPPRDFTFSVFRLQGLRDTLESAQVNLNSDLIRIGDMTQRSGYEQTANLINQTHPPTAIVAGNDMMAFGAMSAIQDQDFLVGKEISVTGFDDLPMAEHSHPPLTTVNQPIYQIGEKVCSMLIEIIEGKVLEANQILLKPELVIRKSTGPINN